jgi:hypothetical protein
MIDNKPIGIIQSRGLGDLVIALPIAKHFYNLGHKVYWPICENFYTSMNSAAPWVNWVSIPVDPRGHFFAVEPIKRLKNFGVPEENILWLYQYLSSNPEQTNPDWFYTMKFDQYKYAAAGLPLHLKWTLNHCITRNRDREKKLYDQLVSNEKYWVIQQHSSDVSYEIDTSDIDPSRQIIEIKELTDNIWDWLLILEKCEGMILIDSVFANIVDQLNLNPEADRYYMRKWNRNVDGNPVFMNEWTYLHVDVPENYEYRSVNPILETKKKLGRF